MNEPAIPTDRAAAVDLADVECDIRIVRPPYGSREDSVWSDAPAGVVRVFGKMHLYLFDSESDESERRTIARAEAYLVDLEQVTDLLDAMDQVGGAAFSIIEEALHGMSVFSAVESVHEGDGLGAEPIHHLLVVEALFVEEPYRGQRLGPRLLATLMESVCRTMEFTLVLLSVEPYQEDDADLPELDVRRARKKIAASFEQVGFRQFRNDIYWHHTAYTGLESLLI